MSSFEVITDSQGIRSFLSKPKLSRQESCWLDSLGQYGITELTLVKGKKQMLAAARSRAHQIIANNVKYGEPTSTSIDAELPTRMTGNYHSDQFFQP